MLEIGICSDYLFSLFCKQGNMFWEEGDEYTVIIENDNYDWVDSFDEVRIDSLDDLMDVLIAVADCEDNEFAAVLRKNKKKIMQDTSKAYCEFDSELYKYQQEEENEDEDNILYMLWENTERFFGSYEEVLVLLEAEEEDKDVRDIHFIVEMKKELERWLKENGHKYKVGFPQNRAEIELVDDFILEYVPKKLPGSKPCFCEFYDDKKDEECVFVIDKFMDSLANFLSGLEKILEED